MNYGFVIDNRRCIGCHACSTACKSENEVPLGVNRTWVKYVEKGTFPDTRRFFQVTRCNHCANPPCVPICPTAAMFQRKDGIVEFDPNICIGCKACMQACPYDAIHIDPESHTAAKCHFCAHRVEVGLEPACVVVCPEHAIIAGDLDNPRSEISRLISLEQVRVRKPEQNTKPKLFYIEAEETAITPSLAAQDEGMLWSDQPRHGPKDWRGPMSGAEGSMAGALMRSSAMPRETYNVPHRVPWHWQVPAYLVTKAVGTGVFLVAALAQLFGNFEPTPLFGSEAALVSLVFIGLTTGLLVWDLDRPERFWTILIRPQWRSWLTRGAFLLIAYTGLLALYLACDLMNWPSLASALLGPGIVLAVLSAIYTAFLFAQCEGRDLWQSTLLPWHLLVQAAQAGLAVLFLIATAEDLNPMTFLVLRAGFFMSLLVNLFLTVGGEFATPHASQVAAAAARMITHGRYARIYWISVATGLVIPMVLVGISSGPSMAIDLAAILSLAGMFAYEWVFVMAPQQVPNS